MFWMNVNFRFVKMLIKCIFVLNGKFTPIKYILVPIMTFESDIYQLIVIIRKTKKKVRKPIIIFEWLESDIYQLSWYPFTFVDARFDVLGVYVCRDTTKVKIKTLF